MTAEQLILKEIKEIHKAIKQSNTLPVGKVWFNAKEAELYTGLERQTIVLGIEKKTKKGYSHSWTRDELDQLMLFRRKKES